MAEPYALTDPATRAARAGKPRRKASTKAAEGRYESDFSKTSCRKANPFLHLKHRYCGAIISAVPLTWRPIRYLMLVPNMLRLMCILERDMVSNKHLRVCYLSSKEQIADALTKSLSTPRLLHLRDKLAVRSLPVALEGGC